MNTTKKGQLLLTIEKELIKKIRQNATQKGRTLSQLAEILFKIHLYKEQNDPNYCVYFFLASDNKKEE